MKKKPSYVYLDRHSLLVINRQGKLRILYTPFRVKCIKEVESIPMNSWVIVEEILQSKKFGLLYMVQGRKFSFRHFQIEIKF